MDTPSEAAPQVTPSENRVKKVLKNSYKQAGFIIFSIIAIIVVAVIAKDQTHFRNKASSALGTTFLTLLPGSGSIPLQPSYSVDLIATLGTEQVDGVQAVFTVSNGSIFSDISFEPNSVAGIQLVTNNKTISGTNTQFQIAYITQVPNQPFSSGTNVSLGRLVFKPVAAGNSTVSFDTTLSKIIRHSTVEDVLNTPQNVTYQFIASTPSPTNTPVPTATPASTPTPTPNSAAPRISNVQTQKGSITTSSVIVIWNTDILSTSQVDYRTASTTTYMQTALNTNLVSRNPGHEVKLTNLTTATKYFYRVRSKSASGVEAVTTEKSFTTNKLP